MINRRIEKKIAFTVSGVKTHITGTENSQFEVFWQQMHKNGLVEMLKAVADPAHNVTHSRILGVSRVENAPDVRAFDFYIASECEQAEGCDTFVIPEATWAIFSNTGKLPKSLFDAEMEAFLHFLPGSEYVHAPAPELEVYPAGNPDSVEFWLPILPK